MLKQIISGLSYKNPIVISSSPLTDNIDLLKRAEENGAAAVSTKLTLLEQPVQGIRAMYGERGLFNFNPSDKRNDIEEGIKLVSKAKSETDLLIWSNIAGPGDDLDGWIKIAQMIEQAGADALELNMICPNISLGENINDKQIERKQKVGAVVGKDPEIVGKIVEAVKNAVKIPVWSKLTTEAPDFLSVATACKNAGGDGIVVNAAPLAAPPIDIYRQGCPKMKTFENCSFGGMCGPAIRQVSYRYIATVAQNLSIPIAGGGGIANWKNVVEAIMFGSSLVTICTQILWDGFPVIEKIIKRLTEFMEQEGYESIDDMKGLALNYIVPTSHLRAIKGVAKVNENLCNGCRLCTRIGFCNALTMSEKKASVDVNECIGCGLCISLCPKEAIGFAVYN